MKSVLPWSLCFLLGSPPVFASDILPVHDSEFDCLSSEKTDQYIKDFQVNIESFGGKELCDSNVDTKKLFNDFSIIENGHFQKDNSGNSLIRGFIDQDQYYNWMKEQTYGVDRGNDVPFATAYNRGGYFTMQDGWALLSTLGRVGTIIHEARHTEGYGHSICTAGPYQDTGVSGCDQKYSDGGAHAVEMEYYARVSVLGDNFHPAYKAMARLMAMARSNFVFNESPLVKKQSLLGLRDHTSYLLDNDRWIARKTPSSSGQLKRTSFGANLFENSNFGSIKTFAIELYENFVSSKEVSDDYSYYKLFKQRRLEQIQDVEEFDLGAKRYFVALNAQGQITSYNYTEGRWNDFVAGPSPGAQWKVLLPDGQKGLFLKSKNNEIFQLDPEQLSISKKLDVLWASDVLDVVENQNQILKLSKLGDLDSFPETRFETVINVPVYDSFEVKP